MARHSRSRSTEVPRTVVLDDGHEVEVLVRCEVSGRFAPATYHGPAEYPDVDVVEVVEDAPGYLVRPDLLDLFAGDPSVADDACEQLAQDEQDRRADAAERDAEARRDARGEW